MLEQVILSLLSKWGVKQLRVAVAQKEEIIGRLISPIAML